VATGDHALFMNTAGGDNAADGRNALYSNATGGANTAAGSFALASNTTGNSNTAVGLQALNGTSTASDNIALGDRAGSNLTTTGNNIEIGNEAVTGDSNTIRIGRSVTQNAVPPHTATFVAGINGFDASAGQPVYILSTGQLGFGPSIIQASAPAEKNSKGTSRAIARYEADNAKLRNELGQHEAKIAELKSLVAKQQATIVQQQKDSQSTALQQQKEIKALAASLKEQASKIQEVSDEVELKKPAPQTAANK